MLTRSTSLGDPQKFYNDAMNEAPTWKNSVFDNFSKSFATPVVMANELDGEFAKSPEGTNILNTMESIDLESQSPNIGTGQWLADEGASMLGYAVNPLTWLAGEAGGALVGLGARGVGAGLSKILPDAASVLMRKPLNEVLAEPIAKYIPAMVGREGAERPLTTALMSEKSAQAFGIGAGAMVPAAIVDNYNRDSNHIAWGGVAREAAEMGGLGLAIGSIPFAWGIIRGKANRGIGNANNVAIDSVNLNRALDQKHITPEEHQWYSDYLEAQKDPKNTQLMADLEKRAIKIIAKNGHTVNSVSNEALFDIMKPDEVTNLHGVIVDQLASNHLPDEQRNALSDYVINNRMDYIRRDPKSLDGVRGYVDFINQKLAMRNPKLAEADEILDNHMLRSVKENMPFSQKELFRHMKKAAFESSHIDQLPVTIPGNIKNRIKLEQRISELKRKNKKEFLKKNKKNEVVNYDINLPFGNDSITRNLETAHGKARLAVNNTDDAITIGRGHKYFRIPARTIKIDNTSLKIEANKLHSEHKGKGHGKNLYKAIIDYAYKNDLGIVSDDTLSEDAMRIYRSLQKEGYKFKENKELTSNPFAGGNAEKYISKKGGAVFELLSAPKKAEPNKQTLRRIEELEAKLPKILTPKEELIQLRHDLLSKGLRSNFEKSESYHRLVDLAHVWHNARTLLDRVHLEHEYNRQQAFRDVSNQILRIADSDMPALAKSDNVTDYLKTRIEGSINKIEPIADMQVAIREKEKVPIDADTILHQSAQIKTSAESMKSDLEKTSDKFKEFKMSPNIFKNLIACVMGGLGG